jgi:hypothetical protein
MTAARLVSVNIGRPKTLPRLVKNVPSSIFKTPLEWATEHATTRSAS